MSIAKTEPKELSIVASSDRFFKFLKFLAFQIFKFSAAASKQAAASSSSSSSSKQQASSVWQRLCAWIPSPTGAAVSLRPPPAPRLNALPAANLQIQACTPFQQPNSHPRLPPPPLPPFSSCPASARTPPSKLARPPKSLQSLVMLQDRHRLPPHSSEFPRARARRQSPLPFRL